MSCRPPPAQALAVDLIGNHGVGSPHQCGDLRQANILTGVVGKTGFLVSGKDDGGGCGFLAIFALGDNGVSARDLPRGGDASLPAPDDPALDGFVWHGPVDLFIDRCRRHAVESKRDHTVPNMLSDGHNACSVVRPCALARSRRRLTASAVAPAGSLRSLPMNSCSSRSQSSRRMPLRML